MASLELLESLFNHLVLPVKTPVRQDLNLDILEKDILQRLARACEFFIQTESRFSRTWVHLENSIRICHKLNQRGLDNGALVEEFSALRPNAHLILHLAKQNAAVVLRREIGTKGDTVIFEAFEASARCEDVLAAEGPMHWSFPGRAAEIPFKDFNNPSFQRNMATRLEQASAESLSRFSARADKAKASVMEDRDTADPGVITQWFMSIIEAYGSSTNMSQTWKRVRDEVNIKNAELPWRRMPLWLVVRVAIQRQLVLMHGAVDGRWLYKMLIANVLADFLEDCIGNLSLNLCHTLKAKLSRRMAKLASTENDIEDLCHTTAYKMATSKIRETLERADEWIRSSYKKYISKSTRIIPKLPKSKDISDDNYRLLLPNSSGYLAKVRSLENATKSSVATEQDHIPRFAEGSIAKKLSDFAQNIYKLCEVEEKVLNCPATTTDDSLIDAQKCCIKIAAISREYALLMERKYSENPEQMSFYILNQFELWMKMEQAAIKRCPMLSTYRPYFKPEDLDGLQLPVFADMERLLDVQNYLFKRCGNCEGASTIFARQSPDSFASRYVEAHPSMKELKQQIENANLRSRTSTSAKWERSAKAFDDFSLQIASRICECTSNRDGSTNISGCTKCFIRRKRARLEFEIHEDLLPESETIKDAIVFELCIPEFFKCYREATLRLILLGSTNKTTSLAPVMTLADSPLRHFSTGSFDGVTMASHVKSFAQTHYRKMKTKVELSEVLRPCAANFEYYDKPTSTWLETDLGLINYLPICGISTPAALIDIFGSRNVSRVKSSYEIISAHTRCPQTLPTHEYFALQSLNCGPYQMGFHLLRELGACNLSFGDEDTMLLMSQICVQAGPVSDRSNVLRDGFEIFRDERYCVQFAKQIHHHLDDINLNWRETNHMELLITLSLRLYAITTGHPRELAEELLQKARKITSRWISSLNQELRTSKDTAVIEAALGYGWWAAVLCRRTFTSVLLQSTLKPESFSAIESHESKYSLKADQLATFVKASIALRDYSINNPTELPKLRKNMLVRDSKMAYQLKSLLRSSILENSCILTNTLSEYWGDTGSCSRRRYTSWKILEDGNWITSTVNFGNESSSHAQAICYNFLEGHLLVDGQSAERLPPEIRASEDVRELFGSRYLATVPSPRQGMTYRLQYSMNEYVVDFGMRDKKVVIQATRGEQVFEFISRNNFVTKSTFDLPCSLVDNCFHWLDLNPNGQLHIRKSFAWTIKSEDWAIDLRTRRASKNNDDFSLISPQSELCGQIATVLGHFEKKDRMIIYTTGGVLHVELTQLDLSFFVNELGHLQCHEHQLEVDPNQNAGTLHGLQSMIVLRDIHDAQHRSIFVRLGTPDYKPDPPHVRVYIQSGHNRYARFDIDADLGRLHCPLDPQLLYTKALLHAVTSLPIPDQLTRRTGTEEAIHILTSAYCQPWTPLQSSVLPVLKTIQSLSPLREYYPANKRVLQSTTWNPNLTASIQQDEYGSIIRATIDKSARIQAFAQNATSASWHSDQPFHHLQKRAVIRRNLYQRLSRSSLMFTKFRDYTYNSRAMCPYQPGAKQTFQTVKRVLNKPFTVHVQVELHHLLQSEQHLGGAIDEKQSNVISLFNAFEGDVRTEWGSLVRFCQQSDKWDLIFRLTPLLFDPGNVQIVKYLCAFGCIEELRTLSFPEFPLFTNFKLNESPTERSLMLLINADFPEFKEDSDKDDEANDAAQRLHKRICRAEGEQLVQFMVKQWPCLNPSINNLDSLSLLDKDRLLALILPEWKRLYANFCLSNFVSTAQRILDFSSQSWDRFISVQPRWTPSCDIPELQFKSRVLPLLSEDYLSKPCHDFNSNVKAGSFDLPKVPVDNIVHSLETLLLDASVSQEPRELAHILSSFADTKNLLRKDYSNDLQGSLYALCDAKKHDHPVRTDINLDLVRKYTQNLRFQLRTQFARTKRALLADDPRTSRLELGNLTPIISPIALLEELRSTYKNDFGPGMKQELVAFGVLLTSLQRQLRIKQALQAKQDEKCEQECQNIGHENWDPNEICDWLLLEIDCNILIRKDQVDVANAIINPASGLNSLLQMNMGQGKTSCVMPMAAAVLGDRKQLCRLIVPKALLIQSADTMQSRLGGLVGRTITHVPYSRRTPTTKEMLDLYGRVHVETLELAGVVVTTPECVLSYDLSGKQALVDGKISEAKQMMDFQQNLSNKSRDILDESDFTLAVKTQLIYPSGSQITVDGHPYRWLVPQQLLALVEDHLQQLQRKYPNSIEIVRRGQGFPIVHFLKHDAEECLVRLLVDDICDGRLPSFKSILSPKPPSEEFDECSAEYSYEDVKSDLKILLSDSKLNELSWKRVLKAAGSDESMVKSSILLLRGLLTQGILLLCLKKRWSVQYGLHLIRQPMAVPYEAKGIPSEQAEFGHPDVAIVLTCLSFYYAGLESYQILDGLKLVLRADDPASEYDRWVGGTASLPPELRSWNLINIEDQGQISAIWELLRFKRSIVHHYMNSFIFPDHAKYFTVKMHDSGWDLPLFTAGSKQSARTTGFSGTNDNKKLLPLNIRQDDLPSLKQTSAEVLTYLLLERNRRFVVTAHAKMRWNERDLLSHLKTHNLRLLIDAGAYILEMSNEQLALEWLDIDLEAKAAVYFDSNSKAWVRYRGRKDPIALLATPFASNLDDCVVYLDQAHTRGVDLKFSKHTCGALTLALGQTKDHTVQAAMGLRQLATTQSVIFFAPPEVSQSIMDLMEQTCRTNEVLQNLYIAQGRSYCERKNAEWNATDIFSNHETREKYVDVIRRPDRQTLEQLYGDVEPSEGSSLQNIEIPVLQDFMKVLDSVKQNLDSDGVSNTASNAWEEVEQERELEHHVEEVRVTERPHHYKPLKFPGHLHPSIQNFVEHGNLVGGLGYTQAFTALQTTRIGKRFSLLRTESKLYVTEEFMRVIELQIDEAFNENFMRPVEWILWSESSQTALIIIPEEAEIIIPLLRRMLNPKVVLVVYAAAVTQRMTHFNNLDYYVLPKPIPNFVIPEWLAIDLGIFAGRTYLNFHEIAPLTNYIKLAKSTKWTWKKETRELSSPFLTSEITEFLVDWFAIRRRGQDITHTPLGYICQGKTMTEDHPFFNNLRYQSSESGDSSDQSRDAGSGNKSGGSGSTSEEE